MIKVNRIKGQDAWTISEGDSFSTADIETVTNRINKLRYIYRSYFFESDFSEYVIETNKEFFIISCETPNEFIEILNKKTKWTSFSRT